VSTLLSSSFLNGRSNQSSALQKDVYIGVAPVLKEALGPLDVSEVTVPVGRLGKCGLRGARMGR
jgi:hypothetical protein